MLKVKNILCHSIKTVVLWYNVLLIHSLHKMVHMNFMFGAME